MKSTAILIGLIVLGSSEPAAAQPTAPILKIFLCKTLTDNDARLKCYDSALSALAEAQPQKDRPEPKDGSWKITEDKSPIDDAPNIVGGLEASDGSAGVMALRCKEHQTDALFSFGKFLGSSDTIRVIYRIDDNKAVNARWNASSTGKAVFVPKAASFIKSLRKNGTLFIRAFDFQGASVDATFNLGDFDDLRSKIAILCKWPEVVAPGKKQ